MIQDRGRKVNNTCVIVLQLSVGEKDSGDCIGIDDMISAPAPGVVLDQRIGKASNRALPGNAKPRTEIYQQIRSTCRVRSGVKFLSAQDAANRRTLSLGIWNSRQTRLDRRAHPFGLSSLFQNALAFAILEV